MTNALGEVRVSFATDVDVIGFIDDECAMNLDAMMALDESAS
jgi:hypothetical protein